MSSTNSSAGGSISSLPQNTKVANSTHDPIAGRRRFYKHVGVAESKENAGLYNVLLDGRVLKSPAMAPFEMPNREIATIIAGEWDAQTDRLGIQPTSMAFMKLAATAVDQIVPDSEFTKQHCVSFLPTDTVLYFTDEEDRILLRKQQKHFTPLIKWMNSEFGIDLNVSYGGMRKLVHSSETVERVRAAVDKLSPFELACLQCVTMECKSIIIALALLNRKVTLSEAIVVSRLEEELQCEVWGVVEGGHDIDRLHNKIRISSACLMYELLQ
jgi:ATP synthase mitochondrial F1 complex assembly factor 2